MSGLRSLARNVAKVKMRKRGMTQICKKHDFKGQKVDSKFARNWKKEVDW